MTSLPASRSTIEIELIAKAPLKNEEIVELVLFISSAESVAPYHRHIQLLRDKYDTTIEMRSLEVEILSIRDRFDMRTLKNFFAALEDQGYHSLIIPAIRGYQEDKNASVYITRLEEIFGIQPDEEFVRSIIDFIDNSNMDGPGIKSIRKHYQHQLDKTASYAPIPDYIHDFDIKINELPHLEEKPITPEMPVELIVDYLFTQLGNIDVFIEGDEDEAKEVLTKRINDMSIIEREQFIKISKVDNREIKDLQDNRDIFRVYGPVNLFSDTDFSDLRNENGDLDINIIFGGARMFTDMTLEYNYEDDLPMDDWFLGYCLQCSTRIRAYHHAVREPHITGGWRGCYCSWTCVRRFIEMDTEHDPDLYNLYVAKIALTREYESQINEIGIQDRDYNILEDQDEEGYDAEEVDQDVVDDLKSKLPKINFEEMPSIPPIDFGEGTIET